MMKLTIHPIVSAFVGTAACAAPTQTHDWPQWQGSARDAISHETGLLETWPAEGPPLAWRIEGLGSGYGGPAIANGRIFGMSKHEDDEVVWARSEADGKPLWSTTLAVAPEGGMRQGSEGPGGTPTVDGDRMYVLSFGGTLACLDVESGEIVWKRSLTDDFGGHLPTWRYNESPLVDGGRVFCTPGGNEATLVAVDKQSGELSWKSVLPGHTDETEPPDLMATLPALLALDTDGNREISGLEIDAAAARLAALDANEDGKLEENEVRAASDGDGDGEDENRRRRGRRGAGGVMRSMKVHVALDADESGAIEATEIEGAPAALRGLDVDGNGVLDQAEVGERSPAPKTSGAGYSSALAVELHGVRQVVQFTAKALVGVAIDDGRLLWSYEKPANRHGIVCSTPIHLEGRFLAASAYGSGAGLVAVSRNEDGSFRADELWFSSQMENHHGGMIVTGGAIYGADGGNDGGHLACLDLESGDVLWNAEDLDELEVGKGSVVMGDGRIHYRTEKGTLLLVEPDRERYVERGRMEPPDRTSSPAWTHPVLANGKLYVRDQDLLFCYDVRAHGSDSDASDR